MNFASKGLSWAENIIHKLEKVCTDSDVVQVPYKYVDAVGEHLSKMLDEVASNWLNPSGDSVDESVSPLEHITINEDNKGSRVQHVESTLNRKSGCVEVPISSSNEDMSVDTSDVARDLSQERYKTRSVKAEAPKSTILDGSSENYKNAESISSSVKAPKSFDVAQNLSQEITIDAHNKIPVPIDCTETTSSDSAGENQKNLESIALSVEVPSVVMSLDRGLSQINTSDTGSALTTSSDVTGENYNNMEAITSYVEDPIMDKPLDLSQDSSHGNIYHEHQIKSVSTEAKGSKFSDATKESYENASNSFTSPADVTTSLPSSSDILPYESYQNEATGESMLPSYISVYKTNELADSSICLDTLSLLASLENEQEQQIEHSKLETPEQSPEVEILEGSDRRCVLDDSDLVPPKFDVEVFEDVNLDGHLDDTNFELALISNKACKHRSYKKKLKDAIVSKLFLSKHRRAEVWYHDIDMGLQDTQTIDTSPLYREVMDPEKPPPPGSCEPDWVFL